MKCLKEDQLKRVPQCLESHLMWTLSSTALVCCIVGKLSTLYSGTYKPGDLLYIALPTMHAGHDVVIQYFKLRVRKDVYMYMHGL